MAPKGFSFGIDKQQTLALGDAVKARLEMERDFDTVDALCPPPAAVRIEGASLQGMAAGWVGLYERMAKRELEGGAPCYRHVRNPILWLGRDDEGTWRGQVESKLGQPASLIKLMDKQCVNPSSKTDEAWQYIDPETKDWEKCWQLNCVVATEDDVAAEKAALPPVPAALIFEGAQLPGALAAGFIGVYIRATEYNQGEKRQQDRVVLNSPCWRQVQNPMLYISRSPDGGWVAHGENALGTLNGFLRLRDASCAFPCDAQTPGTLLVNDGKSWVEAPAQVRCREASEAEVEAAKAQVPTPAHYLRVTGADPFDPASSGAEAPEDYSGIYELEEGHVNYSHAWRRIRGARHEDLAKRTDFSLWLVRGRSGCWVGQRDAALARDKGGLQLPATSCMLPYGPATTGIKWQLWSGMQWREMPHLRVLPISADELEEVAPIAPVEHGHAHHEHSPAAAAHEHAHAGGGECCDDPHDHGHHDDCCGHDHHDHGEGKHEHGHDGAHPIN